MELFKTGLKSVLLSSSSSSSGGSAIPDKGAETIDKLVERLRSASLLEDRRDACRALRSLSKKYRVEVGAQGMDAIMDVLHMDKIDSEITEYALETLQNITSPELLEDEDGNQPNVGSQFTEIFIKKADNVATLLSTLEEYDFRIRLKLIRLLTNLLTNRPREMQEVLLVSPMGISKMMDLLSDAREVVRNEALLLLIALTKSNASIQKIIAFENGFDKILQIIQDEGYSDGGPIVEDCLHLFLNLLRSNTSNQTFFREGSYIKRLLPLFNLPSDVDLGWSTQKVSNFYYMLQIVRTLVSPLNPSQVTHSCQKSMNQCGILESLSQILMANGVPVETLTESIVTVGELIRGSLENQGYFSTVIAPSEPPRPALVLILMTLINDRQLLSLRCAVLYCVQCFLYKNEAGQAEIITALLPGSTSQVSHTVSAGQLICSGLFSKDISVNWFSSIALSHVLLHNATQKRALLNVQLVAKSGQLPMSLLNHVLTSLQQDIKTEVKLGFLQLLSIWLESCPEAVTHFLSNATSIPYLITQITSTDSDEKACIVHGLCAFVMGLCLYFNSNAVPAFTKEALHQLITNRIGMDTLSDGLNQISKSEPYLHSLKHPQLLAKHSKDMTFDHDFCLLFRKYESLILHQLNNDTHVQHHLTLHHNSKPMNHTDASTYGVSIRESPNEVINRYKEVIRGQDDTIEKQRHEIQQLSVQCAEIKAKYDESVGEVFQLKNQLALAQAQNETVQLLSRSVPEDHHHSYVMGEKDRRIEALELQLLKLEQNQQQQYQHLLNGPTSTRNSAHDDLISKLEEENKALVEELEKLKKDQEVLLELLADLEDADAGGENGASEGGTGDTVNC